MKVDVLLGLQWGDEGKGKVGHLSALGAYLVMVRIDTLYSLMADQENFHEIGRAHV